jgi:hypothetical protein
MRSSILVLTIAALVAIVAVQPLVASDSSYAEALRRLLNDDDGNDVLKNMDLRDFLEEEDQHSRQSTSGAGNSDKSCPCEDGKEGSCVVMQDNTG